MANQNHLRSNPNSAPEDDLPFGIINPGTNSGAPEESFSSSVLFFDSHSTSYNDQFGDPQPLCSVQYHKQHDHDILPNGERNIVGAPTHTAAGGNNDGYIWNNGYYNVNQTGMTPTGTVGPSYTNVQNFEHCSASGSGGFQGFECNGGGGIIEGHNMTDVTSQIPGGGDYNGNGGNPGEHSIVSRPLRIGCGGNTKENGGNPGEYSIISRPLQIGCGGNNNGNGGDDGYYSSNQTGMTHSGTAGLSYPNIGNFEFGSSSGMFKYGSTSGSGLFQESEGNGGGGTIGGHNMTDAPPLILDGGDYNEQDGIPVLFHPDQTAAMPSNNFGGVHGHPHHGHVMMVNSARGGSIMHNNGSGSSDDFAGVEANRGGGTNGSSGSRDSWQTGAVEALLQIILDIDPYLEVNAQRKDAWENVSSRLKDVSQNYRKSGKKCKEKYDNLVKYYNSLKPDGLNPPSRNRYKYHNQLKAIEQRRQQAKTSQPPQANHVNGPSAAPVHGSSSAPVTDSTSIAGMVYPAANEFQATGEQWQRDIEARLAAVESSNAIMEASIAALEERTGTRPPIVGNASASSSSEDQREENAEHDVQGANDTDIQ